jgi:uncharacterized protein YehS (DUF1456 family)
MVPMRDMMRDNTITQPARSLTSVARNPVLRRSFHVSAVRRRDHHFDTLRFVQRLQEEGFTEEQSVAMMKVLNDVIEERSGSRFPMPLPCPLFTVTRNGTR